MSGKHTRVTHLELGCRANRRGSSDRSVASGSVGVCIVCRADNRRRKLSHRLLLLAPKGKGGDSTAQTILISRKHRRVSGKYNTYPATHPSLSGSLPGALFPGLHVLDLVVDLVDHLVVCLELEQGHCKDEAKLYGKQRRVVGAISMVIVGLINYP